MAATDAPVKQKSENIQTTSAKLQAAGIASAAMAAATAVNMAVGMRTLQAPDSEKTYVYRDGANANRTGVIDEFGLPLIYDKDLIQEYWKKQGSALSQRWTEFLGLSVPFLTRVITIIIQGGMPELKNSGATLAKDARIIMEKLGPTYIKLGQMMSVRPDVLPQAALDELKILQDSVKPFATDVAISMIESELGGKLEEFFSEISTEPVAAASLAQVYKARLASTGEWVAVKVQRPRVLEVVSKDLYVLRRAAEVYQGLVGRFAPQQRTNYVALLNEWAIGFYTELDFLNEGANQQRLKDLLIQEGVEGVYVPSVYHSYCTRRIMVSEWIDGIKLSSVEPHLLKGLTDDAQEAFLTQLLQVGFFHSDPHPGNLMYLNEPRNEGKARLALIDFGLVASIKQQDMDVMVSAIIHLANRDYESLVDDFIQLEILPSDCDRKLVVPLMDKALTPYVKGGGAQRYEEELRKTYGMDGTFSGSTGGFQQMTQDALTVLNDIPFSIPPYFALLARAIVTLEGIALSGDPDYGIIMAAYPFVARKLLKEDRPEIQKALQEVLYARSDKGEGLLKGARLSVLINSALGIVAKNSGSFVDLDSIPDEAVSLDKAMKFLLSPRAASLRNVLVDEAVLAIDILLRQSARKASTFVIARSNVLPRIPFFGSLLPSLPKLEDVPVPFFIPQMTPEDLSTFNSNNNKENPSFHHDISRNQTINLSGLRARRTSVDLETIAEIVGVRKYTLKPIFATPMSVLSAAAPRLTREEELYALSLSDLTAQTVSSDAAVIVSGDVLTNPVSAARFFLQIVTSSSQSDSNMQFIQEISKLLQNNLAKDPADGRNNSPNDNKNNALKEIEVGLKELSAEESSTLTEFVAQIAEKVRDKIIFRLQTLV